MATRMQQRRGTAAQWTSANPILAAGEIGFETDTGKFKLGNGSSNWASLNYFVDGATLIDGAPALLNTLNELAAALGDDPAFFTTVATNLSSHEADTTNIHGIANTAVLATQTDITNHSSDTTQIHGIADTSVLATNASVAGDIASHNSLTTNIHGIANTAVLATQTDITSLDNAKAPKNNPTFTGNVVLPGATEIGEVSATEIGYVNGVTSSIQTQLDAKSPSASPTFTGTATFTGTVALPSTTSIGDVSSTELGYLNNVSSSIQTQLDAKSSSASPTFTGTVVLPSTTSIGDVNNTEISYLDGVTSSIQNQLNSKASFQDANLTGIPTAPTATAGTNTVQIATTAFVSTAVSNLVNGAPAALDTINELAAALGNDQNYASTITNALALKAPLAGPTFTGTVTLPGTTSIGTVSAAELSYLDGVTSAIQTQIDTKAPLQAPTFTGTVVLPGTTSIGNVSSIEIGYIDGVTSSIQTQIDNKAPAASPTFTGTVVLPSTTSIGTVSATEIGYVDGVTSAIQTQLDAKAPLASPTFTGTVTVAASGVAFTDGTQTKEGVPSRTTINTASAAYNLSTGGLSLRDTLLECGSSSAFTVTIPANSTTAYPVGTSIDLLQTGTGQITVAGAAGVTVNATPGLKLRTQWSSATLFKRGTDTWVVMGDLSA